MDYKEKAKEIKMRRWATRIGLFLHKSRARRWSVDNHQGYMITDPNRNTILYGQRFDLDLDQVETLLTEYEAKLKSS